MTEEMIKKEEDRKIREQQKLEEEKRREEQNKIEEERKKQKHTEISFKTIKGAIKKALGKEER